jgi:type II secretory pathway component PulC
MLYQKLKEIVNGFAGNMTAKKAAFQLEQSHLKLTISGIILCDEQGNRTVIDMANVQHFSLEEWKRINRYGN